MQVEPNSGEENTQPLRPEVEGQGQVKGSAAFQEIDLNRSLSADPGQHDESGFEVDLHRSTAHGLENQSTLLETTNAQDRYVEQLVELLAPFDTETVQRLDETKRPPLALLQRITEEGIFVSGVPVPALEEAATLLQDDSLLATLTDEKRAALLQLVESDNPRGPHAELMEELVEEGLTKAMLLCSMAIPKHASVGIGTFLGVNNGLAAQSISKIGTHEQQALWLNALNRGVLSYGFGLTEEKVGSDPRSLTTTFSKETDQNGNTVYRLNGNKRFIGNAAQVKDEEGNIIHRGADHLVIYAVDDPEKPPKDRSYRAFMVSREAIGEENIRHTGGEHNKMGLREVNNGDFELHDVIVPESCLLGEPDQDVYSKMLGLLDITRLFVGGMGNGAAEAAVDIAKRYAAQREQNGRPIENFQMVSFPLQDLEAEVLAGKLLNLEAAELVDRAESQKALNNQIVDVALDGLKREVEAITELLGQASLPDIEQRFSESANLAQSTLEQFQDSHKVKGLQGEFKEQMDQVAAVTKELRDQFSSQQDERCFTATKDCHKRLTSLAQEVGALEEPVRFGTETAMSKLFNTELAEAAALQAINTLGGYGFVEDPEVGLGLPKRLRDAKVLTIYEGTSNIQRNLIGQGMILQEIKAMRNSVGDGLKFFLLKFEPTKRMYYNVLKNTSRSNVERANAAYKYAVVDVMSRYQKSLNEIKSDWKQNGVPEPYQSWDKDSIERQQNLLASLPVQARMGVLADVAVQRKLLHLSDAHLTQLRELESPSSKQQQEQKVLEHFQEIALEKLIALGRKLGSKSLLKQEQDYATRR